MQVFAPAKINLSLKILGRWDNGFHDLDTLIAPISLYDEIRIDKGRPGNGIEFRCDAKLSRQTLARMAEPIGSDVPFFVFQSAARCKGRGEIVTPIKLKRRFSILLLKPAFAVSTGWAYSRWQHSREIPGIRYVAQEFSDQTFVNDLERPVFEKFVFLARLKMWLLSQSEVGAALMSGSGSTMFAVTQAGVDSVGNHAKAALDPELWTCECETIG